MAKFEIKNFNPEYDSVILLKKDEYEQTILIVREVSENE